MGPLVRRARYAQLLDPTGRIRWPGMCGPRGLQIGKKSVAPMTSCHHDEAVPPSRDDHGHGKAEK
jgi:hypothetical protein